MLYELLYPRRGYVGISVNNIGSFHLLISNKQISVHLSCLRTYSKIIICQALPGLEKVEQKIRPPAHLAQSWQTVIGQARTSSPVSLPTSLGMEPVRMLLFN